jgi:DNA-binding transcriptional MerR regulator
MVEFNLTHFSTVPVFNLKAVVQGTGITATTLRAWERRYGLPHPDRSDSNHRLYSERDIALIRWLKIRLESGLTISQAIELYYRVYANHVAGFTPAPSTNGTAKKPPLPFPDARARLIEAYLRFDEARADRLLNGLFTIYSIEDVMCDVLYPTLVTLGKLSLQGEINKATGHFATNYAKRKVMALFDAQPINSDAPLVVSGCAPRDKHDIEILLVSLFLRGAGWQLLYLGQNVPLVDLQATLQKLRPAMIVMSATTEDNALDLIPIAEMVADLPAPRPCFAFSGYAFEQNPALATSIVQGIHLGGTNPRLTTHSAVRQLLRST